MNNKIKESHAAILLFSITWFYICFSSIGEAPKIRIEPYTFWDMLFVYLIIMLHTLLFYWIGTRDK